MTEEQRQPEVRKEELPKPTVERMRWPFPWVWAVPVFAALVAGWYFYDRNKEKGPEISVTFVDAGGVREDDTMLRVNGVEVGKVSGVELSKDQQHAVVKIRIKKSAEGVARKGTVFWVVRPEISPQMISGLSTMISGPVIQAVPGNGESAKEFVGLEKAPPIFETGLHLILHAQQLEHAHLEETSPVYFRGIQVGAVERVGLSDDASHVDVRIVIYERYRKLVWQDSKFWSVSGADIKGGVLTGLKVRVDSLRSLLTGGVAFATPDTPTGELAKEGEGFVLFDEPEKEWGKWAPKLPMGK